MLEVNIKDNGLLELVLIKKDETSVRWPLYFQLTNTKHSSESANKVTIIKSDFEDKDYDIVLSLFGKKKKQVATVKPQALTKTLELNSQKREMNGMLSPLEVFGIDHSVKV